MLFDFEKEKEILKKITDSLNLCCQCLWLKKVKNPNCRNWSGTKQTRSFF